MKRGEAKRLAKENGCDLLNWSAAGIRGWTLWQSDGESDGLQIDYSPSQLRLLTPEALLRDCKRVCSEWTYR